MADIICRWRNGTPKTVVELVNSLPHEVMPIPQFRKLMETKWKGDFFHTVYQLACQLALYCEAEDGYYYPRFDHDINEAEAHRYLELWISHYYIPNPYVAKNGFKELECPTYLVKSLYDYVSAHPGCDYATAYRELFHDEAKNNDDIVRNYINRYSKVLSFSKDGTLSKTKVNAQQIFSFMDRNNKKQFYDTFDLDNQKCMMDSYLDKDIEQKKQIFYTYLVSTGLAESFCKQYAFTHPFHEEVIKIIQDVTHKNNLFDVIDVWQVQTIHKMVCPLEGNKKQGSAWSAAISNYKNFLDYLEVGVPESKNIPENNQNLGICTESDYVKFKHLLEYFCAHLQYVITSDESIKGYEEYIKSLKEMNCFKYSGQGWKEQNIQKQIEKWEKYTAGRVCINVYASNPKAVANYINWEGTGYNVIAKWDGDQIVALQLVDYKEEKRKHVLLDMNFTLDALGLYDGKEPNENLKKFYDAFADMLKNEPETEDMEAEENPVEPLEFGEFIPSQIIYYGAPGTGKSHFIKKREEEEAGLTCIRTTFHPDSDYSTFVGCYKPHKNHGELTYEFVEQAFLVAYKQAWLNPTKEIALVIEEINRGNCAQVFGDIFQLLDRDDDGWSTYPIKADTDIADYLEQLAIPAYSETMAEHYGADKAGYGFMALPPNMSILATMNTSDQSLFPIDSAFKRRWDWKYVKIKDCKKEWNVQIKDEAGNVVKVNEKDLLSWWDFIKKINEIIASMTSSADKQLGYFFCKPTVKANEKDNEPTIITAETLVGKVLFYLWNDVFKDYGFEDGYLFRYQTKEDGKDMEKDLAFADFYDEEGEHVDTARLADFLNKVMTWQKKNE